MKKGARKKIKKNLKRSYAYTLLKISLVILFLLVVAWILLFIIEKTCEKQDLEKIEESGALGTFGIFGVDPGTLVYFPDDCSDAELKASWDSIFKESSTGTTIISNKDAMDMCSDFVIYKVNGNNIRIINGNIFEATYDTSKFLSGYYGNFTNDSRNFITNYLSSSTINNSLSILFFLGLFDGGGVQGVRNITSSSDAQLNFSKIFKINSNDWEFQSANNLYSFDDNGTGGVYKKKSMDYFFHIVLVLNPINLTQTADIPNFILNESKKYLGILDLSDYFENLGVNDADLGWSYEFSPEGDFSIDKNSQFRYNRNLDFNTSKLVGGNFRVNITLTYPGETDVTSNTFDVNVSGCYDTDGGISLSSTGTVQNLTLSHTDYCAGNYSVREYFCSGPDIMENSFDCNGTDYCYQGRCVINGSINHAPKSHGLQKCLNPKWNKNKNYTIDGNLCFFDEDDDSLTFRYEEINFTTNENLTESDNLTFSWDGSNLTLTSDENWVGKGSFRFFASDSKNETRITVHFEVLNISEEETIEVFEIISPNPSDIEVFIVVGEEKNFSIGNTDYDSIKWYVDDTLIRTGSKHFKVIDLELGNHTVKVEIKKGEGMDSRSWKVYVLEEEPFVEKVGRAEDLIFYIIIFVVLIVIFLVIWIFLAEKSRQKQRSRFGFGISNVKIRSVKSV